jgi:hypothetical protein
MRSRFAAQPEAWATIDMRLAAVDPALVKA